LFQIVLQDKRYGKVHILFHEFSTRSEIPIPDCTGILSSMARVYKDGLNRIGKWIHGK
jgi:hypothetical protein